MADVAGVDHEGRLLGQRIDLADGLFQRAERVGIGGLVEADMAVADLQEGETMAVRSLRLAHNPERVRYAAGDGPQHAGATPGHAFQDFAPVDAVSLVEFTHLRISFQPLSPKPIRPCGLQGKDWAKASFIPGPAKKIEAIGGARHDHLEQTRRVEKKSPGSLQGHLEKTHGRRLGICWPIFSIFGSRSFPTCYILW